MKLNRGWFAMSEEFLAGDDWPLVYKELKKVFHLQSITATENGILKVHGWSSRFNVDPNEGDNSPQYELLFGREDGKPVLKGIKPV
jgi:hypothetical protein